MPRIEIIVGKNMMTFHDAHFRAIMMECNVPIAMTKWCVEVLIQQHEIHFRIHRREMCVGISFIHFFSLLTLSLSISFILTHSLSMRLCRCTSMNVNHWAHVCQARMRSHKYLALNACSLKWNSFQKFN